MDGRCNVLIECLISLSQAFSRLILILRALHVNTERTKVSVCVCCGYVQNLLIMRRLTVNMFPMSPAHVSVVALFSSFPR